VYDDVELSGIEEEGILQAHDEGKVTSQVCGDPTDLRRRGLNDYSDTLGFASFPI